MLDTFLRFVVGGSMVCLFACLGEIIEPKSFAGLFGAAPSIALASLGLTIFTSGVSLAVTECRGMLAGAIVFTCYSLALTWMFARTRAPVFGGAIAMLALWFAVAFGLRSLM